MTYRGTYFDEQGWDGSDVFMPADRSSLVFVTERIAAVLLEGGVSGVAIERADRTERPIR